MAEGSDVSRWGRWYASLPPEVAEGVVNLFTLAGGRAALAVRLVLDGDVDVRTVRQLLEQAEASLRELETVLSIPAPELTPDHLQTSNVADSENITLPPADGRGMIHRLSHDAQPRMLAHLHEAVQHCRIAAVGVTSDEQLPIIRLHTGAAAAALADAGRLLRAPDAERE